MKKTVTQYIIVFSGILFMNGCSSKDLNVPSPTQTESTYFTTEGEFRTTIIGAYSGMTDFFSSTNNNGSGQFEGEIQMLPGDDLTNLGSEPLEFFGNGINSSLGVTGNYFASCYVFLNRANKILNEIVNAKPGVYKTPNLQSINEGEALFLRAFGHYQLWNVFGTAPLDTIVVNNSSELTPPSSKGTGLLDQAITDLNRAAPLLAATLTGTPWGPSDIGRVTANSAWGLLGKCLVFRGTVNKSVPDYAAALTAFSHISGVSLTANFEDNFDASKENNQESLFEFQAGSSISGFTNAWLSNDQCNCGVASAYWNCFGAGNFTSYMGGGVYNATQKLQAAFDPADPRAALTFNGNLIQKYILKDAPDGAANSDNNPRILRYADVLLLEAEATLQSGGSAATAIGFINQVRTRARNMVSGGTVPANLDISVTDHNTIMQWIMDERFRELAAEGQRWYDLRRWTLGGTITPDNNFFSSVTPTRMAYDAHFLNFPIPQGEISKNAHVTQNPGY
jgi:hypothetical protein